MTTDLPRLIGVIRLPDAISGAPFAEQAATYAAHQAEARRARSELEHLEKQHALAAQADADAFADALKSGKRDPGNKHVAKLEADIEDARRVALAWTTNANQSWEALNAEMDKHLDTWRTELEAKDAEARAAVAETLDTLDHHIATADEIAATTAWIDKAKLARSRKRQVPTGMPVQASTIHHYTFGSGDLAARKVLDALKAWTTGTVAKVADTEAA